MEEKYLDMVMVPLGLLLQATYHIWLFFTIVRHPNRTVIGVNAQVKHRWLRAMMAVSLHLLFFFKNVLVPSCMTQIVSIMTKIYEKMQIK